MVFKFQKILFLEFRVARVSKKRPGSVRVFKNTGTAGQISGRVWTRPSPKVPTNSFNVSVLNHNISVLTFSQQFSAVVTVSFELNYLFLCGGPPFFSIKTF